MKSEREFLRHTVATVAYRGAKAIDGAPAGFADFNASATTRTPAQILAHLGDLFDWALSMARGEPLWRNSEPLEWKAETERFFAAVKAFDDFLASDNEIRQPLAKLFQGPVADALTHVGQINLLRRIYDAPVKGENYYRAEIEVGRVGAQQSANRVEFE